MWGQLIGALVNKGQKDQAAMNSVKSPDLSKETGFQSAKPQMSSGGAGGLLSGAADMIGGGGGAAAATDSATPDLGTSSIGGAEPEYDPITGQSKGMITTGFNGLKTKLY